MSAALLKPGSMIGDHQLVKKLGEGAIGTVFEAVHGLIGKRVAIKVLKRSGDEGQVAAKRLLEEARAVNAIQHRGIIDIFDAGLLADGRPYLVMELLVGHSVHDELKRAKGGLPMRLTLHVLTGMLEALAAAHRAGVIHRDLKASNVFLVEQRAGLPLVKLVDFGIARRQTREEVLTMPSMTVGSLGFMAPEHLAGQPVLQSDLYSVGCLAWLMLAGRPVFPYGNQGVLVQQHLHEKAPSVRTARKDVTAELDAWVSWLLEKRVEDRPHSAEVARDVLHEAELALDGLRTVPGGPSFIELAKDYDRRARAESSRKLQPVTDLNPAFVPPSEPPKKAQRGTPAPRPAPPLEAGSQRTPRVLTASRRTELAETGDDDTLRPPAPTKGPFDSDISTVVDTRSRRRR